MLENGKMAQLKGIAIAPEIMAPIETCEAADVAVDTGINGDARGKKRRRQVSILFEDDWQDASQRLVAAPSLDSPPCQSARHWHAVTAT